MSQPQSKQQKSSSSPSTASSHTSKTSKPSEQHDPSHKDKTSELPASDASIAACSHVAVAGFPQTQSTPQPLTEANLRKLDKQNEARYGVDFFTTPSMEVVNHRRGETVFPGSKDEGKKKKK
ncbi:hypothetical protein LTR97_000854 [Elasticomyces elasticus]|uniref:Uncharacterized protein n=1 Tax=Elasticomyces elasticus TaxID=574655 RepID=A0AAN8A655_9PEZI|nr:hypothetical protein LTR97_000854 [Elasticomyces elasticus]